MIRPRRTVALVLAAVSPFVASACGGSSALPSAENKTFCALYEEANKSDTGAHGSDPAAMTDPAEMKKSWAASIALADKLLKAAPSAITDDMRTIVENLHALDDEFVANDYDITAMSKDAKIRARMDRISTDAATAKAKANYVAFADKACGTSYGAS